MKQNLIIVIALLLGFSKCPAQSVDSLYKVMEEVLHRAKTQSLYTHDVNWDSLSTVVLEESEGASSYADLKIPLTTLIDGMRDHHAAFFHNNQRLAYISNSVPSHRIDTRIMDNDIWHEVNYNSQHEFYMIDDKTGYVKLVGIGAVDVPIESKRLRGELERLAEEGAEQWILDLRYNGGGNMYPMLACLAPLLGDGRIGSASDLQGDLLIDWTIRHGNFYYGDYLAVELPPSEGFNSESKIVVLTSLYTVSSGEVVTTAFKGRKNTVFIGENTGGYTTVTSGETINDQLVMSISISIYTDRNGVVYYENIPTDIDDEFVVEKDISKDTGINKALDWLKK